MCRRTLVLAATLGVLAGIRSPAQEQVSIDRVAWLQGCWSAVSPQQTIEETWMASRGGAMLGISRTVRGDAMAQYELVVLREENGGLVYQAHPSGQPSVVFPYRKAECPGQ